MGTALEVNHVWKKFNRGEFNDSLRDAIPAMFKSLIGLGPSRAELQKNEFWALKDIDFKVEEGESVALIGHNGAGKSTLLKIFSKILKPNRGSIRVNGRMRALIEIGSGFHGDLTGRENIFLNGSILGMSRQEIKSKFDAIVDFAGIEDFLDMPVKRYSSGMFARLGFAVAAHLEPEILIVDEVLAVGDIAFQRKCLSKMDEITKEGRTVIFVSHNMSAVRNLCHRSILFNHGEMVKDGPTGIVVEEFFKLLQQEQKEFGEKDRSVYQKAVITQTLLGSSLSSLGEKAFCQMNGELYLRFYYKINEPIDNVIFYIVVIDYEQRHVVGFNTHITEKQIGRLEKDGYIDFYIPKLPLIKGLYSLTVGIFERDLKTEELHRFDHRYIVNCIDVGLVDEPGWHFTRGIYQACFVPFEWDIHKGD